MLPRHNKKLSFFAVDVAPALVGEILSRASGITELQRLVTFFTIRLSDPLTFEPTSTKLTTIRVALTDKSVVIVSPGKLLLA